MGTAETFVLVFALLGVALGAAGGAAAALAGTSPVKTFAVALALHAGALALQDFSRLLSPADFVAAIVIGPLLVFVPPAAGFVAARRLIETLRGSPPESPRG